MDSIEKEPTETYKVLWIVLHVDEHLSFEQIRSTIYGCTKIYTEKKGDGAGRTYECFYFSHSMFHRYQQLDAVVVQTRTGWYLCVNNYARRYSQFKQCRLYTLLKDGVIDPGADDFFKEYACLVADCSIDRCQTEDVLEYIKKTYQFDFARNFDWNVLRGVFAKNDT